MPPRAVRESRGRSPSGADDIRHFSSPACAAQLHLLPTSTKEAGGPKHTRRKRQVSGIIEHLSPECDVSCGAKDYVNELGRIGSHAHDSGGPRLQFGRNFGKIP